MDAQAATLLSTLKRPAVKSEDKVNLLNALKSDIKHYRCPESAQATIFECLKIAIAQQASSTLASSAFSTLGHLIKRLKIQDATGRAITQLAPRLFPALHDRLGDHREQLRDAASQALTELYPFCTSDVEVMIRDEAMGGSNARAKQSGLLWVLRMHNDESMPFKSYTQAMVARLEDSDGTVRETAKNTLIELFSNAPAGAKADLKKQMKAFSVRHSIESQILAQVGLGGSSASASTSRPQTSSAPEPEVDMAASTRSLPTLDHASHFAASINSEAAQPPPVETVPMDPIYVQSRSELEDMFRTMLPYFEGKETEQNWTPRDKSILKLRRLTKGNAPSEFHQTFMPGLKSMVEGILKVANSLRTTMSTNGCQLVQELARTLGPALDPHVEMLLQSFIKMSAATKHIAAENGKSTTDAIFQNCSYHARMMQHIWSAAQDKNVQTRQCATEWLRTILKRQANYKHHFETSGGLELAEKCIKKGLDDANPKVKEATRATYWTFAKSWPDKANAISSGLDPKSKTALDRDSNNPNAALHASTSAASTARETGAASRNALRERIAEQRRANAAGRMPDRPNSAMAQLSPAKPRVQARPKSNLAHSARAESARVPSAAGTPQAPTTAQRQGSSLMTGAARRPRRPEMQRPQTADPYASRRLLRPETPANPTPGNSPPKGTANSKSSIPTGSAAKNRAKTSGAGLASPAGSPARRSPRPGHLAENSRPTSKGSEDLTNVPEDELTMVMPKNSFTSSGGAFVMGHKRPGLGQTMSVDAGLTNMAEEEGFTMVLPNLQAAQQRAQSPLSYRSPLKAMFEEAREKVESMSPKLEEKAAARQAEERAATPRSASPSKNTPVEEVQIYEDPFTADTANAQPNGDRTVLGELPVNENVRMQSPTQSNGSTNSPAGSPRQVSDASRSPLATAASTPQDRAEVLRNKRLLGSGIDRIRTKTLDAHGFRRVQDLAKSQLDIWEGGKKYDELMGVLLEYLTTFDQEPRLSQQAPHKAIGLKAQALGLVRALLYLHKKNATAWYGKVLVAVLNARKTVDAGSHVLADIEKTADEVLKSAAPEPCIDAILSYLSDPATNASSSPSTSLSLSHLRALLSTAQTRQIDLGSDRKIQLVQLTARFLDCADAEVRKADVELASDLFELFGSSKGEFWGEFKGTDEGRLGLLTYYIARRTGSKGGSVRV
jgi:CLIP-associating protein 1/2